MIMLGIILFDVRIKSPLLPKVTLTSKPTQMAQRFCLRGTWQGHMEASSKPLSLRLGAENILGRSGETLRWDQMENWKTICPPVFNSFLGHSHFTVLCT